MNRVPKEVIAAWENRDGAIIFSTVDKKGIPNSIYATCVSRFKENIFVIADNYFDKTRNNILSNNDGAILFITKEGKAYQMKGSITYHKDGEIFEDMKKWNPEKHPGHAAVALSVKEVYSGSSKLL